MFLDKIKYLFLILIVIGLFLPFIASAGWLDGPIVPCGRRGGPDCTLCHIFEMGKNIIQFIWELIITIAPIFILIGGIMILTAGAKPDQATLGKKIIFNAIIGIVIALVAWTILSMVFNALVTPGSPGFPWPWNEVHCTGGGVSNGEELPPVQEGEYCVCEVPVYDLNPNDFPSQASIIGTNVKATKLTDKDTCKQGCVSGNVNTYCPFTLAISKANLYCANKSTLQNKKACAARLGSATCQIGTKCYNSESECLNDGTTAFKSKCFLNGQNLCACYTGAQKNLCGNSSDKYVLYRLKAEEPYGGRDVSLWDCPYSDAHPCRLNCQIVECEIEEDNCGAVLNQYSCFGGFICKNMTAVQEANACHELTQLLSCMAGKNLSSSAKIITSISDNSGNKCFDLNFWNSVGQCPVGKDSCTWECCAHKDDSLHYGGKQGTVDCRRCSWAIDFADENSFNEIKKAAQDCGKELWAGGLEKVDVEKEGNHVHVELDGVAEYHGCK